MREYVHSERLEVTARSAQGDRRAGRRPDGGRPIRFAFSFSCKSKWLRVRAGSADVAAAKASAVSRGISLSELVRIALARAVGEATLPACGIDHDGDHLKGDSLQVRIDPGLLALSRKAASRSSLSLSDFVRSAVAEEIANPWVSSASGVLVVEVAA